MELWVFIAVLAAAAQTVRFGVQKVLAGGKLSAAAATWARFLWSWPFAALLAFLYGSATGAGWPTFTGAFFVYGILGGTLVSTLRLDFNLATYLQNTVDFLEARDIVSSLTKGAVFGFIAALMGCYYGLGAGRGAAGVGRATKSSVVATAVLILAANFLLTEAFFST